MARSKGGAYCKYCGDPCDVIVAARDGIWNYDNWIEWAASSCCEEDLVDENGEDLTDEEIDAVYDPTPY